MTMRRAAAIGFAIAALATVPPAHADALDGDWCSPSGQSLRIEGPSIRLPSGLTIEGHYHRHTFDYQAPANDPDAGQLVHIQQIDEQMMHLRRIGTGVPAEPELWRRCNVTS